MDIAVQIHAPRQLRRPLYRRPGALAPVTSNAGCSTVYWTSPQMDLITVRWMADDLSSNSSLSVTNVDGNLSVSLQAVNRSKVYCCCL